MSRYDGTTDLEEHVDVFTTQAGLYTSDDAILYRVFPTSLKGSALNWFTRLPPNSIDCFDTLVTRFGIQFVTSKPHHLTSLALINIRQEKGESLREFMKRFGMISLNISNLNPEVAMHHLVTALKPGSFVDSLCKKPVSNLDELRTKATKFMQMEELKEFRSTTQSDTREKKYIDRERVLTQRPDSRFKDSRQPKYNRYTPLVSNKARILEEALNADLIATPQRVPTPPNADTTKHYRYHRNYGHTTEDCFTLKDKIEEPIQVGYLRRFVKREERGFSSTEEREGRYEKRPRRTLGYQERQEEGTRRRVEPEKDDEQDVREKPLRGVINYISGGFAGGRATMSARKKYVRAIQNVNVVSTCPWRHMPPITFCDDDFQAINPQHDDPMVISVEIDDFAISKTLVDQGSSMDILYWGTFKKLRISKVEIQQYSESIMGF